MKGFVKTPENVAQRMVSLLFKNSEPSNGDQIFFPGVGEGPFIRAVHDYCDEHGHPFPEGLACDTHGGRLRNARERFAELPIRFENTDFLSTNLDLGEFDYVIGNPPYVPITKISEQKKERYREDFKRLLVDLTCICCSLNSH